MSRATICDRCEKVMFAIPDVRVTVDIGVDKTQHDLCRACSSELLVSQAMRKRIKKS